MVWLLAGAAGVFWLYWWLKGHWLAAFIGAGVGAFIGTHAEGPLTPAELFCLWVLPWGPVAFFGLFARPARKVP